MRASDDRKQVSRMAEFESISVTSGYMICLSSRTGDGAETGEARGG
jgi:hypothetical protein